VSVNDSPTTVGAFFTAVATRLQSQLSVAANRVFVVDKLRLIDPNVPNFQIEPVSMNIIADESGTNAFYLDFRVHAVTKTEYDYSDKPTQKLVRATSQKGAFQYATDVAGALNKYEATGASNIVITSLINGGVDTTTGMSHATATFRTMLRVFADG
jgi:hypothetical protein